MNSNKPSYIERKNKPKTHEWVFKAQNGKDEYHLLNHATGFFKPSLITLQGMRLCQRSCNGATAPSWLQFPLQFEAPHCQFREELGAIGSLARWEIDISGIKWGHWIRVPVINPSVMKPWLMKQAGVYRFWSQFAQFWGTSLQFNQSTKALLFQGGHGKKQNPVNLRTSWTSI